MSGAAVSNAGTIYFNGGTETLSGAAFTNTGTINISGSTLTFNTAATMPGTVNFSSGTINGTGNATFANQLPWTGGTMSGSGTTTLQAGMAVSGGSNLLLDGRTLTNSGTTTFSSNYLHGKNGAAFNNATGALVDLQGYNNFIHDYVGAIPAINNAGTFRKSSSTTTIDIAFAMNNTGKVRLLKGVLNLSGGGTSNGTFSIASGTTLGFT